MFTTMRSLMAIPSAFFTMVNYYSVISGFQKNRLLLTLNLMKNKPGMKLFYLPRTLAAYLPTQP